MCFQYRLYFRRDPGVNNFSTMDENVKTDNYWELSEICLFEMK